MGAILSNRSAIEEGESDWMSKAHCKDMPPSMFFPKDAHEAKIACDYCGNCIVQGECLEYALERREDHGVWGGASERERRRMLKRRRLAQQHNAE